MRNDVCCNDVWRSLVVTSKVFTANDVRKPNFVRCVQGVMSFGRGLPRFALLIGLLIGLLAGLFVGAGQAQNAPPKPNDVAKAETSRTEPSRTELSKVDAATPVTPEPAKVDSAKLDSSWKDKQIPEWTEDDAKQLLADSPWARKTTVAVDKTAEKKSPVKVGRHGGWGIAGMGLGRHGGSHASSEDAKSTDSGNSSSSNGASTVPDAPLVVTLRWASALPIREAELKARDTRAPMVDEAHYAIEIYGLPRKQVKDDSPKLADLLKANAAIRRTAKEDLKPSSVEIILRDDGPVVVYLFPRKSEINWRDHEISFEAQVGNLKIKQAFQADDMKFHGTLEL